MIFKYGQIHWDPGKRFGCDAIVANSEILSIVNMTVSVLDVIVYAFHVHWTAHELKHQTSDGWHFQRYRISN